MPRIRAGLEAYVRHVTEDPRRARIAHHEMRAVGVLENERHAAAVAFARVIEREAGALPQHAATERRRLLGLALTGAVSELLVDWTLTEPHPPIEPLVQVLTELFTRALA